MKNVFLNKLGKHVVFSQIHSCHPFAGDFIRDLVALDSGGSGGVVWRIRANPTKLVCAVGSRNGTEETKLLVLDFECGVETSTRLERELIKPQHFLPVRKFVSRKKCRKQSLF